MATRFFTIIALCAVFSTASCNGDVLKNVTELSDGDLSTAVVSHGHRLRLVFDGIPFTVMSYSVCSSGNLPAYDPVSWTLSASEDGKRWTVVDRREDVRFCSRFQPVTFPVGGGRPYKEYRLDLVSAGDSLSIGEVAFSEVDNETPWADFRYPEVDFEVLDQQTEGASIYAGLVQNPDEYIRYHARQVAGILFYSAADSMNTVGKINYFLKDYDGVSAKSGNPEETTIVYSTRHIEHSAEESMYKLDFETRGVLFHELVHAYQFEPKGIGTYSTNREFWACTEGLADAVRAESGFFDMSTRKPGGNWLDGYRTTGFFIQWLKCKDQNAIRKFHESVRDLDPWSFDGAVRYMFGEGCSIEGLWEEYQTFLAGEKE